MTPLPIDRYTKLVLTVIAAALVVLALKPYLGPGPWGHGAGVRAAEAQTPATPSAPAAPQPVPGTPPVVPAAPPVTIPSANPAFNQPWWDDCTVLSKETVPAIWGRLVGLAPGAFLFESDDLIRLVRTAPYEAVAYDPSKKPCKILEIKKTK
jgi:hypothetical protein